MAPSKYRRKKRIQRRHACESCGEKNATVQHVEDPYASELAGDKTKHWLCEKCQHDHAQDI